MQVDMFYESLKSPKQNFETVSLNFPDQQEISRVRFDNVSELMSYINRYKPAEVEYSMKARGKYFYLKCKWCTSQCSFYQGESVRIIRINSSHLHNNHTFKKQQESQINDFIFSNMEKRDLCSSVMKEFRISKRRYYYITQKSWQKAGIDMIIKQLDKLSFQSRIDFEDEQQTIPSLFLTISPKMIQLGRSFGDAIHFDITYNLTNNQFFKGVGLFTGFDRNLRIFLLGVVLVSVQSPQNMKKIFKEFIEIHKSYRSTFITDGQHSFRSAFEQLRQENIFIGICISKKGIHSNDIYHVLKNTKKRVGKILSLSYSKISQAKNKRQLESLIDQQFKGTRDENLRRFLENGDRYLLALHPDTFVGFYVGTASNEKMNDLLKTIVQRQTNLWNLFQAIRRLEVKYLKRSLEYQTEKRKFEILFRDDGIRIVRNVLEQRVFQKFLQLYCQAMRIDYEIISENKYLIEGYEVVNNQCLCGYFFKTGMICSHTLKSLWIQKRNQKYIDYIGKRWKITQNQINHSRIGRPVSSRKNRH